jgi:hypothetical protein
VTALGRAVIALDDLLLRPDVAGIVGRLRAAAPTWLVDQLDSAARDIEAGVDLMCATGVAAGKKHVPAAAVPDWVRLGALDTLVCWITGGASTCMHSPVPDRPTPLYAAAWRPGLIACGACVHLLALPRGYVADRRCDGCGHLTTGVGNGDGIWPTVVALGPLSYSLGCCRDCRWYDEPLGS